MSYCEMLMDTCPAKQETYVEMGRKLHVIKCEKTGLVIFGFKMSKFNSIFFLYKNVTYVGIYTQVHICYIFVSLKIV